MVLNGDILTHVKIQSSNQFSVKTLNVVAANVTVSNVVTTAKYVAKIAARIVARHAAPMILAVEDYVNGAAVDNAVIHAVIVKHAANVNAVRVRTVVG